MAVCWKAKEQYTGYNCMNPYSKELAFKTNLPPGESFLQNLSKYAKSYLKSVCQFERLYQMYMSAKNDKEVMITQKYELETYGLLAKGDMIVMVCVAHNRTSKWIGEILNEQLGLARHERDRRFIIKYY